MNLSLVRPSLLWSGLKLVLVLSVVVPLLLNNSSFSCSWTGSTQHGYYSCNAYCSYDTQIQDCQINGTSYFDAPEYCSTPMTHTYNEYIGNYEFTCSASVKGTCWEYYYWVIIGVYITQFLVHLNLFLFWEDFDPQQEMVDIASTRDINSETITKLMHPANSFIAICDSIAIGFAITSLDSSYVSCNGKYISPTGTLRTMLLVIVVFCEVYGPVCVHALNVFKNDSGGCGAISFALLRLDVLLSASLLRGMQVFTSPVSVLSWLSVHKRERAGTGARWLNMDVRESFTMYALSSSAAAEECPSELKEQQRSRGGLLIGLVRRLGSRYTVQYSFLKLLASIVVSLSLNQDYNYCSAPQQSFSQEECPSNCRAHCIFSERLTTEYYASHSHTCDDTTGSCFCYNWVITDLLAMIFNTVHFVLQCYYLIRYNNFDPQQNQIDCVQSYTFVGDNITLFLTHPAICLLSVLESAVLLVVWLAVVYELGTACPSGEHSASSNISSGLTFALLMTAIEVYKANMTVATNAWRERRYFEAAFSLLRVDLFVFYGSTLFLQTFLFPFSILGYLTKKIRKRVGRRSTDAAALIDRDGDGDGDEGGEEEEMPVARESGTGGSFASTGSATYRVASGSGVDDGEGEGEGTGVRVALLHERGLSNEVM